MNRTLAYLHPVSAGLLVALLLYVGSLGLRARSDPRRALHHLTRHARLAPIMFGLMLIGWLAGVGSTYLWRPDLRIAASPHFRIGLALVTALSAAALSSRWITRPWVRDVHPWFGAAAMLLAVAQVFFGLQITP